MGAPGTSSGDDQLPKTFLEPPDSARPGVYWYFMDGNLSREGMTRDLESMAEAGLGHLVFLEVNVGVPRGPVDFLSDAWQELFVHAVREAERLGIEITLGVGPGWTGSGGPWVRAAESMQHLVASQVEVEGPGAMDLTLPVPPPHRPFFGDVPAQMKEEWEGFYRDVAVLAYPTPAVGWTLPDIEEKALVYRAPFSSQPGVKPYLEAPAEYPAAPEGSTIPVAQILELTAHLQPEGRLNWQVPEGRWTVLRLVSRNNGASTRPAPAPGIGFECDKFDAEALDAHFEQYVGKLLKKVGARKPDRGWTMLHMDSWEMGAQNWTPRLREEFRARRGYDPLPYYPAVQGFVVESREISERFLWDLRRTAQELVIEYHAGHLKGLARQHGFGLSIEPYDMNPANDFDLGAVADVPMCEFWSVGFDTTYSCQQASSIAHILGRTVVAAEAFTGAPGEDWKLYPGALKNQGDWAFGVGINRLTYHTFAHKPDEGRPGMVMGPYGVHWDRGQTWWPMVGPYHRSIARCQQMLRQGRLVADILYLMPEGAPNIFQPPPSASTGSPRLPDRRGYNYDGCSARALLQWAGVRDGRVVFPSGASYRILILPNVPTMTPELGAKLESLIRAGATVVGTPPRKSPSLVDYPACDQEVVKLATALWGSLHPPGRQTVRPYGEGRLIWGGLLSRLDVTPSAPGLYPAYEPVAQILDGLGAVPDFESPGPIRYTHRRTEDREIYFVANRSDTRVVTTATFRLGQGTPELWNPLSGSIRALPEFTHLGGRTSVPLQLDAYASAFVVFPTRPGARAASPVDGTVNFTEISSVGSVDGPWDVSFDAAMGAPARVQFETLEDWTHRPEPGIRYYSGIASYRTTFDLPAGTRVDNSKPLYLELGDVKVMARVWVNHQDCGVVWTAPWRVEITDVVRVTHNVLEVEVANLWPNRMIGDAREAGAGYTQTSYRPFQATDPLLPSGLLGPVTLRVAR
jgi:hypothetical protein